MPATTTDQDTGQEDKAHADIGLVCALPIEVAALLGRCERVNSYRSRGFTFRGGRYDQIRIAVVEAGLGYARAREAALELIRSHSPNWLLSIGFSGALIDGLRTGHIVVANEIVDQHGQHAEIGVGMTSNPEAGLFVGRVLTIDHMVRTVAEKRELGAKHGAIAVDMESLAVAQVGQETRTPYMVVRSISDDVTADLPPEVLSIVGDTGAVRIGAALTSLVKRPSSVKDMLALRSRAQATAQSLATFLDGVIHQLPLKTSS